MWDRDVSCVSDNSSPAESTHLGAAGDGVSLWTESYLISPVSCLGHTPLQCVFKSSNIKVCCLRSLLILVSVHWLINHECFNCTLTLMKWMDVIYQLGVQWGDVGRKCLLTELFFISSLARSASPLYGAPLKRLLRLKLFSSYSDNVFFHYYHYIFSCT